jgi:hypothetical protein
MISSFTVGVELVLSEEAWFLTLRQILGVIQPFHLATTYSKSRARTRAMAYVITNRNVTPLPWSPGTVSENPGFHYLGVRDFLVLV